MKFSIRKNHEHEKLKGGEYFLRLVKNVDNDNKMKIIIKINGDGVYMANEIQVISAFNDGEKKLFMFDWEGEIATIAS